jgi:hypothetical protein
MKVFWSRIFVKMSANWLQPERQSRSRQVAMINCSKMVGHWTTDSARDTGRATT